MAKYDIPVDLLELRYALPHLQEQLRRSRKVKLVAIGSSSTAGSGTVVPYPPRLERSLRSQFPFHVIDVLNRGINGQEAPDELARFDSDVLSEAPALVLWQVGTNAIFHDQPVEQVAKAISVGLDILGGYPIDVVLMDPQYTPALVADDKAKAAELMVALIGDAAEKAGVSVFSRFSLMRHQLYSANLSISDMVDADDPDCLHMSELATKMVAEGLSFAIARAIVGKEQVSSNEARSDYEAQRDHYHEIATETVGPSTAANQTFSIPGVDDSAARRVNLLFATTRCISDDHEELFSGEREPTLTHYGTASVRVPELRAIGTVPLPFELKIFHLTLWKQSTDPKRHFTAEGCDVLRKEDWLEIVRRASSAEALVFVHGFNVAFVDALYRCAQIAWDIRYSGIPILFSWASRGKLLQYIYDQGSALDARSRFVSLLCDLQAAGIRKVHVLAHSMGNYVVLDALANHNYNQVPLSLGNLLMAAPDVDKNHYLSSIPKICPATDGITLYASCSDKAMVASRELAGGIPRAGDVPEGGPILAPPVVAIDASEVGQDILGLNHGIYAAKASILNDIRLLLAGMEPPRLVEISGMPQGTKPAKWWRYMVT
jgi:esterase/lipase superfamily enzyme